MNLIDKDEVLDTLDAMIVYKMSLAYAYEAVYDMPTVYAVAVIRCKECIHGHKRKEPDMFCDVFGAVTENEWFCSRAERKKE